MLTGAVVATRADQSQRRAEVVGLLDPFIGFFPSTFDTRQRRDVKVDAVTAAVSHMLGFGDFTLRTGIEGQRGRIRGFSSPLGDTVDSRHSADAEQ